MSLAQRSVPLRWCGTPTGGQASAVLDALAQIAGRFQVQLGPRHTAVHTVLDTADRRLDLAGLTLTHDREREGQSLVVSSSGEVVASTPLDADPSWPARVEQLPPGTARDAVANAMWVRAVLPVAAFRSTSRAVSVLDAEGKTVVRLTWVESTLDEPITGTTVSRVVISPVLGYRGQATAIRRALLAGAGFEPADEPAERELLRLADTHPEPRPVQPMSPDMPAGPAVATALLSFAVAILANLDGTIEDVDTEFLHDLRVAVRRSRSLLKVGAPVLAPGVPGHFGPELRWLGDLTTPTRDLDVYLLELDELGHRLEAGKPADLEPFGQHLRRQRAAARRGLVRGLRSQRFDRLMSSWDGVLVDVITGTSEPADISQSPTAAAFAATQLRGLDRRVTRLARSITPASPSETVHTLRKRCKEFRYALEVFAPLCAPRAHGVLLKDLKQLQDVLGQFQDGEVQQAGLRLFAQQMLDGGRVPVDTVLAMGELSGRFAEQQHQARFALTDRLSRFVTARGEHPIQELLP